MSIHKALFKKARYFFSLISALIRKSAMQRSFRMIRWLFCISRWGRSLWFLKMISGSELAILKIQWAQLVLISLKSCKWLKGRILKSTLKSLNSTWSFLRKTQKVWKLSLSRNKMTFLDFKKKIMFLRLQKKCWIMLWIRKRDFANS